MWTLRNLGLDNADVFGPITIGDNVHIGWNAIIMPNVHIGNNVVIGAGSVVTKDIPDWSFAAGNPCRVIKKITDDDKTKLFHNEEIDEEAWNDIVSKMNFSCKEE